MGSEVIVLHEPCAVCGQDWEITALPVIHVEGIVARLALVHGEDSEPLHFNLQAGDHDPAAEVHSLVQHYSKWIHAETRPKAT